MNEDGVVRIWTEVARESKGESVTLAHVCAAAVTLVGVNGVGVTVRVGSSAWATMHATDETASTLEELQVTVGQGPCVDAFSDGGPVLAADLTARESQLRWPAFAPGALGAGARAIFAVPLQIGAIRWGAMDLYRSVPGGLDPDRLADALAVAECVNILLLDGAGDPAGPTWPHLDRTAHQAEVHQATGMLVVQLGVSAEAAFARLRGYAYAHDRKLGDVARDVVARRLRFDTESLGLPYDEGDENG